MEIEISQKKYSLIDKYDIYVDKQLTFNAKRSFFTLTSEIKLFNLNNKEIVCIERENLNSESNYPSYTLSFGQNSSLRLITESFVHYRIPIPEGYFHVYEQEGRKLALFLNDEQTGIIEKNKISYFAGDKYQILIDADLISKELVIAFTLAYDDNFNKNKGSIMSVDFGNVIIDPDKEADLNWKPKN